MSSEDLQTDQTAREPQEIDCVYVCVPRNVTLIYRAPSKWRLSVTAMAIAHKQVCVINPTHQHVGVVPLSWSLRYF